MNARRWLSCILLGCLIALLASGVAAQSPVAMAPRALILYDSGAPYGWIGELHAVLTANLLGHFPVPYDIEPVESYAPGQLEGYSVTFYFGTEYDHPLPAAFVADVMATDRTVCWLGYNLWQIAWTPDWWPKAEFTNRYGFQFAGVDGSGYAEIWYKGVSLIKDTSDPDIGGTIILDPLKAEALAEAYRPAADGEPEASWPYVVHSGHFWYFADTALTYLSEEDRYLAFCDLLHDIVGIDHPSSQRALMRIEDVDPTAEPTELDSVSSYLETASVPFQVGVIPVFKDPLGLLNGGVPQTIRLSDAGVADVRDALSNMLDSGGQIFLHGYTHQYDSVVNPYSGLTGDDSEFFLSSWSEETGTLLIGPVPEDSVSWVNGRIDQALAELTASGYSPVAWETPHYVASALDNTEFGKRFDLCSGRMLYFTASGSHFAGQFFPYPIKTDIYGQRISPENLGNVEPFPFYDYPLRYPEDIVRAAQKNLVIRDGWASAYFHPWFDRTYLTDVVEGVQALGYAYVPAPTLVAEAGPDKAILLGGSVALEGSASGGDAPYTYSWSPTTGLSDPESATPDAGPPTTITYLLTVTDNSGQTDNDITTVTLTWPPPVADFSGTPTTGTAPLQVTFTDLSTNGPTSWSWSFGDGYTSTQQHPTHTYQNSGGTTLHRTVSLTVTNPDASDTETKTGYIAVVPPQPVANFSATPLSGTAPLQVTFVDLSTHNPTSWSWSFGDGTSSAEHDPKHTYQNPGGTPLLRTVTLTVASAGGADAETKTNYITVIPPAPVADFSATPTNGTAPLNVTFTDLSTHGPTSWSWNFGDGGTATTQHPAHVYNSVGVYTVSLAVTSPYGSDSEVKSNHISVRHPDAPVADFGGSPTAGTIPLTVNFTDTSTKTPTSWSWTFGDGGASADKNPSHQYANPGLYTVALTATNVYGSDTRTKAGYINATPPPPAAGFTGAPTAGMMPLTVNFADTSTNSPTSWSWTFGDGGASASQHPSHEYTGPGSFTVTLAVTNAGGTASETKIDYITVMIPPPVADFTGSPTTGTVPLTVSFIDASADLPTSWSWSFGDGWTSTSQNPSHQYTIPGSYTVSLTATNGGGADSEIKSDYITVTPPAPVANFLGSPTAGTAPLAVGFTDLSTNSPTSWFWSFGDGDNSSSQDPSHEYASPGSYTVTLTATNAGGGDSEIKSSYIAVTPLAPAADFTGSPTTGAAPLTVTFSDLSANSPTSWFWDFGDGQGSTAHNPSHQYASAGTYTVALTATNAGGGDTNVKTNYIAATSGQTTIFSDDFDSAFSGWTLTGSPSWFTGTPKNGTHSILFEGNSSSGIDEAITRTISTVGYRDITVSFYIGGSSLDSTSEYIIVEWYNGSSWTEIMRVRGGDAWEDGQLHLYTSSTLASSANNKANFQLRFAIYASSSGDTAYVDDVVVQGASGVPIASFTASPTTGTVPLTVSFSDASTNSPTSWSWSFGDGGASTAHNPSHEYASPGAYTVSLRATNAYGSNTNAKASYVIAASPAPVANFAGSPTSGSAPLVVSFTDLSSNSPTSWSWDFGDGGTSTQRDPSHAYTNTGGVTLLRTVSLTAINSSGSDTEVKTDYISAAPSGPVADFAGTPTMGTAPLNVSFTDLSTNHPTSWSWNFGDGATSTQQNPSHTYANTSGTSVRRTVSLTATNDSGSDTETKTNCITVVPPAPAANFSAAPASGTTPLEVTFSDLSTNSPTSWSWSFGDGATSTAQHPTHTYTNTGGSTLHRTVGLTATNDGGSDTETKTSYISVIPPAPVAEFSGTPTTGTAPLPVTFADLSTNGPTSWSWNFGDGSSSTAQNPSHTYTNTGGSTLHRTVGLTATNDGGSDTETKTNYISVVPPEPAADFSATPTTGTAPLPVTFSDLSTNSPTSWLWSFGDGSTSTQQNPSHTYQNAGGVALVRTVGLAAANDGGSDTETKTNYITVVPPAPVAEFSATPTNGTTPLEVTFSDLSANSPTSWSWSFGDGSTSTAQNPTHTYTNAGGSALLRTVALTATNDGGADTETKVNYIAVIPLVGGADFTAAPTAGTAPLQVSFTDLTASSPTSWSWSFGDGSTSTAQNPIHTYQNSGGVTLLRTVSLTAGNAGGSDTETKTNYISVVPPIPAAAFSAAPTSGAAPLGVAFTDASTNSPTSWSWSFGDGATSTVQNPSHTYTSTGGVTRLRTVSLTATNDGGSDTETKTDYISVQPPAPIANFSAAPTSGTAPLNVTFSDLSTNSPTSWSWSFGDGSTSNQQHPTHIYQNSGDTVLLRTVGLTATNDGGSDTETKTSYISVAPLAPIADFSATPTAGTVPLEVTFTDLSASSPTSWSWDFGDASTSAEQNPSHTYEHAGVYTISLTATNVGGSDTETKAGYLEVTFADVPADNWAYSYILACVNAGIVQGYWDGYHPDDIVNRAQMSVFIARALAGGDSGVPPGPATPTFSDVSESYWAYKYVEYCYAHGVVQGYWDGYHPDDTVTRAQMAVFVARAHAGDDANVPAGPDTATFPDVATDYWAYKYVEYCYSQGIVQGYWDGYHPEDIVTRAQMAVFVQRAFDLPM